MNLKNALSSPKLTCTLLFVYIICIYIYIFKYLKKNIKLKATHLIIIKQNTKTCFLSSTHELCCT